MTFSYPFAISPHKQGHKFEQSIILSVWRLYIKYPHCLREGRSIRAQYILYRLITATIPRIINRTSISGRRATRRDSYTITIINKGMCIYNKSA